MKLKVFLVIFVIFSAAAFPAFANPETEQDEIIERQLQELNLETLERELEKLRTHDPQQVFFDYDLRDMIRGLRSGELSLDFRTLVNALLNTFFGEVMENLVLLGQVVILAGISALLQIIIGSMEEKGISELARGAIYLVVILLLVSSLQNMMSLGQNTIAQMVSFMQALVPPLLTMLVGVGAVTSAAIFQPLVFLGIVFLGGIIQNLILPVIFFSGILTLINGLKGKLDISQLIKLLREGSSVVLGIVMVLFVGLIALQGAVGAIGDGLTLRTAKYLTGAFVPVVGSMFADAVELIVSCSLLIKNALGILGLLGIVVLAVYPVVKVLALVFIFKIAAAIIQPLGEENLSETLDQLGDMVMMIFVALSSVSIMFFVCLTVVIGMANMVVMLR